jgi:uncharacterized protein YecE (DUF72 family)
MPKPAVLEGWAGEVPEEFRFVLKGSRAITHMRRLKDCAEPVVYLIKVAETLGKRLGPLLFQLPPNFKKDISRLGDFLALFPAGVRVALEFRHQSWFEDDVFDLLRKHGAALCIAEAEDELEIPFVSTADWGYLRLRMPGYTDAELKSWIKRIRSQPWGETYVFFKHEDEAKGPALAQKFLKFAR